MTRTLYQCLVWLHPPAFRRRFAAEMMCIFEEAATENSAAAFFADGLASLARQWSMNQAAWTIVAIVIGNLPFLFFAVFPHRNAPKRVGYLPSTPDFFVVAVPALLVMIATCLIFAVSWFRFVQRRRS